MCRRCTWTRPIRPIQTDVRAHRTRIRGSSPVGDGSPRAASQPSSEPVLDSDTPPARASRRSGRRCTARWHHRIIRAYRPSDHDRGAGLPDCRVAASRDAELRGASAAPRAARPSGHGPRLVARSDRSLRRRLPLPRHEASWPADPRPSALRGAGPPLLLGVERGARPDAARLHRKRPARSVEVRRRLRSISPDASRELARGAQPEGGGAPHLGQPARRGHHRDRAAHPVAARLEPGRTTSSTPPPIPR